MFKAVTGTSTNGNAKVAGSEAAQKLKGLAGLKMAFAFASCDYDLDAMLAGIATELPGVPVIGNTSFTGIITQDGYFGGKQNFLGMMGLAAPEMTVGVAAVEKTQCEGCPVKAGVEVAKKAMEKAGKTTAPVAFFMACPPGEEEFYLKGITQVIGRVPFFGGSAADNTIAGAWKLYTDKGVFADGVAVAFFYGVKPITNKFTGAYHETTDRGIITKLTGKRTLVEIDGVPALKKYADWRGLDPETLKGGNLLAASIVSPIGVKDRLGDLVAIRHPMNGNDDYSMAIGNNLAVGTAVIRMEATVDELIASTGNTLTEVKEKMQAPGAYFLVHCGGRLAGIGARVDEVAKSLKEAAGTTPFLAEFTFGEYGYEDDGLNTCGGLMLSFTGFEQ